MSTFQRVIFVHVCVCLTVVVSLFKRPAQSLGTQAASHDYLIIIVVYDAKNIVYATELHGSLKTAYESFQV